MALLSLKLYKVAHDGSSWIWAPLASFGFCDHKSKTSAERPSVDDLILEKDCRRLVMTYFVSWNGSDQGIDLHRNDIENTGKHVVYDPENVVATQKGGEGNESHIATMAVVFKVSFVIIRKIGTSLLPARHEGRAVIYNPGKGSRGDVEFYDWNPKKAMEYALDINKFPLFFLMRNGDGHFNAFVSTNHQKIFPGV